MFHKFYKPTTSDLIFQSFPSKIKIQAQILKEHKKYIVSMHANKQRLNHIFLHQENKKKLMVTRKWSSPFITDANLESDLQLDSHVPSELDSKSLTIYAQNIDNTPYVIGTN